MLKKSRKTNKQTQSEQEILLYFYKTNFVKAQAHFCSKFKNKLRTTRELAQQNLQEQD